ncbi:MAG: pantoate--beta-alanine ligase [Actinobacteria bacterium]|nr:pantoate--beta-alanine ligase [Actinomycetota bacterium]
MKVVEHVAELREHCESARRAGHRVGLVPTMGYFHAGHRSLMRAARAHDDFVVVTLFVNPTQFGPNEDLSAYPRDLAADVSVAIEAGVDILFAPSVDEMDPGGPPRTKVHVAELTEGMCGAARPTHFDGVTTVVAKLFSIVGPCRAYFGRKDYQQLAVVRRMTQDLNLPVEVVGCPLVREPDGLAMSSRNAYLTADERAVAPALFAALVDAVATVRAGERDARAVERRVADALAHRREIALEYVELRGAASLEPLTRVDGEVVLAVAGRLGRARLIDNVVIQVVDGRVDADLGVEVGADEVLDA